MKLALIIRRLGITVVLAFVLALGLALLDDVLFGSFVILWPAMFCGWPYLSRRLGFDFPKAPVARKPEPPGPKRPLWLRLVRGTVVTVGKIALALFLLCLLPSAPLFVSYVQARRAHDSVRVSMTVPEVLHAVTDCDLFQASSDFAYDDKADADNIPAMSLGRTKDGIYRTQDLTTGQDLELSESEAIARLRAKLHDGSKWSFRYTYINMTPQHVSFSVVFGPDGRVAEVKPVYGWD